MAVSQNTCYEVVNISWLNSLVGNAVQDSNGNTVNVNQTKSGTTYCPTYKQLTDGTFIPYRSESSDGPASDVDGITVNRKCHATGENYADNQLVNKHDVAVCNTRLDSFTISIANASTAFDGCTGGTKNLSYTRTFTRNTWDMLSCSTQTESSHSTASTADTRDGLITWRTSVGSISNKVLTVGKNTPSSTGGSSSRTITVSGSSTFHGTVTTATASTTQGGVSGEYKYWKEQEIDATNYRVVCTGTGSTFGCAGGSYSAAAKHDYKVETFYRWRDVCGTNYDSWSYSTTGDTQTKTDYSYSNSFSDITSTGGENSDSWSKEGYEGSCSWSQSCAAPVTTYTYGTGSTESSTTCDGGSMTLSASNIPYTATTTYGDGHSEVTDTGTITGSATVTIPACYETTGCSPSDTVAASPHGYFTYTVSQTGCSDPVTAYTYGTGTVETSTSCAGGSITITANNIPYTATTQSGSQPTGTTAGTATVTISECTDTGGCTTGPLTVDATSPAGAKITYTVTQTGCTDPITAYTYGTGTVETSTSCAGGSITLTSNNIPYTATTQSGSQPTGTTAGTVTVTIGACTDGTGCTTGPTTVDATTPSGAKITYTVTQTGCNQCSCDNVTWGGTEEADPT